MDYHYLTKTESHPELYFTSQTPHSQILYHFAFKPFMCILVSVISSSGKVDVKMKLSEYKMTSLAVPLCD